MLHASSMLTDAEGQIRRSWSNFHVIWADVEAGWRDQRRLQWEKEVIEAVPGILSLTTAAISELREAAMKAMVDLADPERSA